jgi:hypothetical protein
MSSISDLPKSIRDFLARDLAYVVGGGTVLTSFFYSFNRLPTGEIPVAFTLLGIGLSYVIGYAIQDLFSISRIVTTAQVPNPNRFLKWAYKRFENRPWKDLPECSFDDAGHAIQSFLNNDLSRSLYERTISFLILGATNGPCMFVASLFVFVRWCLNPNFFDFVLIVLSLLLGCGLVILCWLKAMEMTRIDVKAIIAFQNKKNESNDV